VVNCSRCEGSSNTRRLQQPVRNTLLLLKKIPLQINTDSPIPNSPIQNSSIQNSPIQNSPIQNSPPQNSPPQNSPAAPVLWSTQIPGAVDDIQGNIGVNDSHGGNTVSAKRIGKRIALGGGKGKAKEVSSAQEVGRKTSSKTSAKQKVKEPVAGENVEIKDAEVKQAVAGKKPSTKAIAERENVNGKGDGKEMKRSGKEPKKVGSKHPGQKDGNKDSGEDLGNIRGGNKKGEKLNAKKGENAKKEAKVNKGGNASNANKGGNANKINKDVVLTLLENVAALEDAHERSDFWTSLPESVKCDRDVVLVALRKYSKTFDINSEVILTLRLLFNCHSELNLIVN
jgi:hypothetical protein